MQHHMIVLKFILISVTFAKVCSLETENIIGDDTNIVANPEDYGYHITLLAIDNVKSKRSVILCGGSIISEKHVITAAHCVKKKEWADELYVLTADNHVIRTDPSYLSNYFKVAEAFLSAKYNYDDEQIIRYAYDFSILKIQDKFSRNYLPFIKILSLPTEEHIRASHFGLTGRVLGRGRNKMGKDKKGQLSKNFGTSDFRLRSTMIRTFPKVISYKYLELMHCHKDFRICGTNVELKDTEYYGTLAPGDSGGGLVDKDDVLIGMEIASLEYEPGSPDVVLFVNISYNIDVINDMISDNIDPRKIQRRKYFLK